GGALGGEGAARARRLRGARGGGDLVGVVGDPLLARVLPPLVGGGLRATPARRNTRRDRERRPARGDERDRRERERRDLQERRVGIVHGGGDRVVDRPVANRPLRDEHRHPRERHDRRQCERVDLLVADLVRGDGRG